jgi:hypothetical protein
MNALEAVPIGKFPIWLLHSKFLLLGFTQLNLEISHASKSDPEKLA